MMNSGQEPTAIKLHSVIAFHPVGQEQCMPMNCNMYISYIFHCFYQYLYSHVVLYEMVILRSPETIFFRGVLKSQCST